MSNIEIDLGCDAASLTMIYRIDDEPGVGDTVPNRGTYPGVDLVVQDLGDGELDANVDVVGTCALLPWTILVRIGNFSNAVDWVLAASPRILDSAGVVSPVWSVDEYAFFTGPDPADAGAFHQTVGTVTTFDPSGYRENQTIILSIDGQPTGSSTAPFRVVSITAGPTLTDVTSEYAHNFYFNVLNGINIGRPGPSAAGLTWADGVNGLAVWREYLTLDAEFLAKYNEFLSA